MRTTNAFTAFFCYFTWSIGHAFAPLEQSARLRSTKLADSFIEETILASMPTFNIDGPSTIKKCRSSASRVNNRHSSRDWIHNVASLPRSSVLREIMNPVLSITAWSTVVSVAHKLMKASSSTLWNNFAINMCVPTSVHSLIVSSLGLLLVFRTNSAYQRFVEGRKIWEQILSVSRNLSRMLSLYESDVGTERIYRIKNTMAAFPYLLRHHLRPECLEEISTSISSEFKLELQRAPFEFVETRHEGDRNYGGTVDSEIYEGQACFCTVDKRTLPWSLLSSKALSKCANAMNRPLWACDRMAKELVSIPYSDTFTSRERLTLLGNIDKLSNAIGECERIHQTSVPLNYARHALRSLTLWLLTLPFALVKDLGLITGPVVGITAWLMFGIYQIGHSIEDPFQKTLRLSILCNAIRRDVLGETEYRISAFSLDDSSEHMVHEQSPLPNPSFQ